MPLGIDDIIRAFDAVVPVKQKRLNEWLTNCPCCQNGDPNPSLRITFDPSTGKTIVKDFEGDHSYADIAYAVGLEPIAFQSYDEQLDYERKQQEKEERERLIDSNPIKFNKAKFTKKEGENNMADSAEETFDSLGEAIDEDADNQTGEQWLMVNVPEDKKEEGIKETYKGGNFDRYHIYRNGNRKVIYKDNKGEKIIYQDHWDPESQKWLHGKNKSIQNMLFMPDLEHPNLNNVDTIFFCEGEKDCITLFNTYKEYFEDGKFMTVSKPNGAGSKLEKQFIKEIKEKTVCVFYDNDDTGKRSAVEICNELKHYRTYLVRLETIWPNLPKKADVTDYLKTHPDNGKETLIDLINKTERYDETEPTFPNPDNYNLDYNWNFGSLNSSLYELSDNGVWESHKKMVGKNEEIVRTHITETPIWISGIYINSEKAVDTEKTEFKYIIDGRTKTWTLPQDILFNASKAINALPNLGVSIDSTNIKGLIVYLRSQLALNRKLIPHYTCASHFGWATDNDGNTIFVPYDNKIKFDGIDKFGQLSQAVKEKGDYFEWLSVATTCRASSWGVRLVMDACCASLIVGPTKSNGFFCHIYSNQSGSCKTVVAMLGASIFGNPKDGGGFLQDFNSTIVGMEAKANALGNLPFIMDELQMQNLQKDGRRKSQLQIYELTQGSGRSRSNINLGLTEERKWACSFITTGETSILDTDSASGAENRVIEIKGKQGEYFIDKAIAHDVAETITENYGFAGKKLVQFLLQDGIMETVKKEVKEKETQLMEKGITNKQAQIGALILVMDEILGKCIFDDENAWTVDDMINFDILKYDENINNAEKQYNQLMGMLSAGESHFVTDSIEYDRIINDCWGKIKDGYIYINRTSYEQICKDYGLSEKAILDYALDKGYIEPRKNTNSLIQHVRISRISKSTVPVYKFIVPQYENDEYHYKSDNEEKDNVIDFALPEEDVNDEQMELDEDYSEYPFN